MTMTKQDFAEQISAIVGQKVAASAVSADTPVGTGWNVTVEWGEGENRRAQGIVVPASLGISAEQGAFDTALPVMKRWTADTVAGARP
jgi:hypothetical protein